MEIWHTFFLSICLNLCSRWSGDPVVCEISRGAAYTVLRTSRCAPTSPEGIRDLHCLQGQEVIWLCLQGRCATGKSHTLFLKERSSETGAGIGWGQTTPDRAQDTSHPKLSYFMPLPRSELCPSVA